MGPKNLFFLFFIFFGMKCSAVCTGNIPENIRMEYASELHNAFVLQSEGLSTSAMFHFEQGCMKAINAGETAHKIEAIRKLFVWYRTYGYYSGFIKQDPQIVGQYLGGSKYSTYDYRRAHLNSNSHRTKEQKEVITEYLFGTAQIISALLCVWYLPTPNKYVLGISLATQGVTRIYDVTKPFFFQDKLPFTELEKAGEVIKAAE
jgi:hypothetical protein